MPKFQTDVNISAWSKTGQSIPAVCVKGTGPSKKAAEHDAAEQALLALESVTGLTWPKESLNTISRSKNMHSVTAPQHNALMA